MIEELTHLVDNFSPSQVLAWSINLNLMCERIHRIKKKLNILLSPELSQSSSQNNPSFLMIFFYRGKGSKWIDANAGGWKKIMLRWTSGSVTSVTTLLWLLRRKPRVLSSSQSSNHCNACPVPSSSMSSMSSSGGTSDVLITPPRTTIAQSMNWDLSTAIKPPNLSRISKRFHVHSFSLLKLLLMNKINWGKIS